MDHDARPDGMPTFGFTEDGRVVRLSERAAIRKPLRLVTAEGWSRWYPATDREIRMYLDRKSRVARADQHEGQDLDCFEL